MINRSIRGMARDEVSLTRLDRGAGIADEFAVALRFLGKQTLGDSFRELCVGRLVAMSVEGAMAAAGNFFGLTPKGDAPAPESSAGPARAAAGGAPESSSGSDAAAADSPACRPERTSQQTRFSSALPPPAEGVATGQKPAEGKEGRIMRMAGGLANAIGLGRSSCNRNSAANERASKTGQGERSSVRSRLGYDATRKRITRAAEMRTTMLSRQQNTCAPAAPNRSPPTRASSRPPPSASPHPRSAHPTRRRAHLCRPLAAPLPTLLSPPSPPPSRPPFPRMQV